LAVAISAIQSSGYDAFASIRPDRSNQYPNKGKLRRGKALTLWRGFA